MKCNHCGSEWTTTAEIKSATCPFCGKQLESANSSQPAARGRFQLSYDQKTLVQFLGDEKNVVIPAGVTRICAGAFHGYGIETVYIPDGVVEIGDNCFNGCKQLREVRIPASVTHISDSAFRDTGKKTIIAEKGSYAWNKYAKPELEAKPSVAASHRETTPAKETIYAQSADNIPSAKTHPEQQRDDAQTIEQKKIQWAQMLNSKPGDRPWIIKASLFVSADKRARNLVTRIKNIHDQELLALIIEETNDGRVRLAAAERITDQSLLKQLTNNKDAVVRRNAFLRIASPAELKKHLLESVNKQDASALGRISNVSDLLDIALSANCDRIRITAADMLPANSTEGNLLKAAAAFSKEITMEGIVRYDDAHLACQEINPSFLQQVAQQHPDPCVRYLARGRKDVKICGNSFEEQMKSQTITPREVTLREVDARRASLLLSVEEELREFQKQCRTNATKAMNNCTYISTHWYIAQYHSPTYNWDRDYFEPQWGYKRFWRTHCIDRSEADFFEKMLKRKLREEQIQNATVSNHDIYQGGTTKILVAHAFEISTNW